MRVLAVIDTCRDWVRTRGGPPKIDFSRQVLQVLKMFWDYSRFANVLTLFSKFCRYSDTIHQVLQCYDTIHQFFADGLTIHHFLQMHYSPMFADVLTLFTKFCRCTDTIHQVFADVLTLFTKFCRCTDTIHQVFAEVLTLFTKRSLWARPEIFLESNSTPVLRKCFSCEYAFQNKSHALVKDPVVHVGVGWIMETMQ